MEYFSFEIGGHYAKCHDEYKEKTGELAKNVELLSLCLPPVVRTIRRTNRDSQFNVLSVGSGDGVVDLEALQIVQAELQKDGRPVKLFHRAVEPNHYQFNLYNKAIETLPDSLKGNVVFDVRRQTFQEYTHNQDIELATKFHLVLFNHSIYFDDPEQILRQCFEEELKENSQVVVVVSGKDMITTTRFALSELEETCRESTGDKVMKAIQKNGWKYEMFSNEYEIDVTDMFNDASSIQGNLLLDFLTHIVNFRATACKEHFDKIISQMLATTIVRDGKRYGKKIDLAFIISK